MWNVIANLMSLDIFEKVKYCCLVGGFHSYAGTAAAMLMAWLPCWKYLFFLRKWRSAHATEHPGLKNVLSGLAHCRYTSLWAFVHIHACILQYIRMRLLNRSGCLICWLGWELWSEWSGGFIVFTMAVWMRLPQMWLLQCECGCVGLTVVASAVHLALDQLVDAMTDLWSCRLLTLTVSIWAVTT